MKSCEKGGSPSFAGEWQKKDSLCGGSLPSEKEPGIGLLEGAGRDLASVQEVADCLLSLELRSLLGSSEDGKTGQGLLFGYPGRAV